MSTDHTALTGRIAAGPDEPLREEVLRPQLEFELAHLLPQYVRVEKALLVEYARMGLVTGEQAVLIARVLDGATPGAVARTAEGAMSDLCFALERYVAEGLPEVPPAWHVDRSRNDVQACAQLLFGRSRVLDTAELLISLGRSALRAAGRTAHLMMPGHTHMQAAQLVSPAFWFAALGEQLLHTLSRLGPVYATANTCPLGAGAMAGQELEWDRAAMAALLGCDGVQRHALRAVAQRDWALEACAEFSMLGVALSRFVTDLMTWGGAGHGFLDLPDDWSGVSSAMPQKKNFPVLERIRGRTAHLSAAYHAIATAQRATPYSNSVEVSKEAGAQVPAAFDALASVARLLGGVLDRLRFDEDRLARACEAEYFGGFTLANLLTLRAGVPWRAAQVVAGRYIAAAIGTGLTPAEPDGALFERLLAEDGHEAAGAAELLREAMDVTAALRAKRTAGSTGPGPTREMLAAQAAEFDAEAAAWAARRERLARADAGLAAALAALPGPAGARR
ncbi:argininosuccinate lyase [Bailinhaonella thermotolerans]|uniref:argininosuccinate lyase n=1 Tax=Bailinhaonella thermotolerans TaxID=1070861 RepID=A0A3A4B7X0_9ACTN|nr:lyase family protein [Bailinhaonella thermotolerans]RJL34331.1 argininosuccinate lyase [Bailinhaonella thermotolerans]